MLQTPGVLKISKKKKKKKLTEIQVLTKDLTQEKESNAVS